MAVTYPHHVETKSITDLPSWYRAKFEAEVARENFTRKAPASLIIEAHNADELLDITARCLARANYNFFRIGVYELARRVEGKPVLFDSADMTQAFEDAECVIIYDLFAEPTVSKLSTEQQAAVAWYVREFIEYGGTILAPTEYKEVATPTDLYGEDMNVFIEQHFEVIRNEKSKTTAKRPAVR